MPTNTLGGMFNEPKKTSKRNFIRENVKSVNQLQGMLRGIRTAGMCRSRTTSDLMSWHSDSDYQNRFNQINNKASKQNLKKSNITKKKPSSAYPPKQTFSDQSVQTTDNNFENSDVMAVPQLDLKGISLETDLENLVIEDEETTMRQSNLNSASSTKCEEVEEISEPKLEDPIDPFCPPGHRLLPEEERIQTLNNLKEKYVKHITELNSLSLRNDTLRMRNRRTDIENELKNIDAGIKTFDRPKVYIKT